MLSNSAPGQGGDGQGGGICIDQGSLSMSYSSLAHNVADDNGGGNSYGGGIFIAGAAVTVTHSAISANQSAGSGGIGGGIFVNSGTVMMTNTTVSGNLANDDGGGIYNTMGTVRLDHVTISANVADNDATNSGVGGGIFRNLKPVDLKNTILAGNVDRSPADPNVGPDCYGGLSSHGDNLIGDETGCDSTVWQASDQVGGNGNPVIDPMLDALADNGGATHSHALQSGSPEIDAGTCTDIGGSSITNDQRLVDRPQGVTCDIGAYEAVPDLSIIKTVAPTGQCPLPRHGKLHPGSGQRRRGPCPGCRRGRCPAHRSSFCALGAGRKTDRGHNNRRRIGLEWGCVKQPDHFLRFRGYSYRRLRRSDNQYGPVQPSQWQR